MSNNFETKLKIIVFSFRFPGLRKVYPYYFTFTTFTKGRWVNQNILDVFAREFRAHPAEEYVSFSIRQDFGNENYLLHKLRSPI